jgi:hypothetical protein
MDRIGEHRAALFEQEGEVRRQSRSECQNQSEDHGGQAEQGRAMRLLNSARAITIGEARPLASGLITVLALAPTQGRVRLLRSMY